MTRFTQLSKPVDYVVKPITDFAFNTVKDYVSYIRSYDDNMNNLKEKLRDLCSKKQDINSKVRIGKDKLEKITKEAAYWLQSIRKLTKDEELKKLVLLKHEIAEEVLKLMEKKDLKKLLREDIEMQEVVIKVVKEHNEQDFEIVTKAVVEVMKDNMEEFTREIKEDIKVAMVAITLLKDEELEKLISEGDSEMASILNKSRDICEEKSWELSDDSDEVELLAVDKNPSMNESTIREVVGKLPTPLKNLTHNEIFMKALPENVKLGVEMMDALWKSSIGLKGEMIATKKHRSCYYIVVPIEYFNRRYEMSKATEVLAKEIESIIGKMPTGPVTLPGRAEDLKAIPSGFVKGLESREELLQKILSKLKVDQVNSVGVYGMGGTGKTTLAKEVNIRAKSNFDTILMVEISETPSIERIQDQLAQQLNLNFHAGCSLPQKANMLYTRLKQELDKKTKTLIILDNMWRKLNLDNVGIPCESNCCKFLVTSREKNVCQTMGIKDDNIFQLGLLNNNESEKLFYHHVGEKHQGNYVSVVQRLLRKCGGLSLTIVATANALKGKDFPMWQHFANELEKPISSQMSSVHRETYTILETSYKVMESEEKKMFFLLVCLGPHGSGMSIENLMRYGIGLELFEHVNNLSEALEQVETWVMELVSSSLLMEGDSQLHVKIHDEVRASAISFAAKDKRIFLVEAIPGWISKETFNKYTAISLLSSGLYFSRLNGVKAEMLQILLLRGNHSYYTSELADGFFQGMENLKVLHLSYMNMKPKLPESIGVLKNLKTLHLEECRLGKISVICELVELVVVSLRDSVLEELPDELGKLVNLRMLDMGRCEVSSLENCNVIASLSSLEGLCLFNNFKEWAITTTESNDKGGTSKRGSIAEFQKLRRLNLLQVHVQKIKHLPLGDFSENLDSFSICIGDRRPLLEGIDKRLRWRTLEFNEITLDDHGLKDKSCLEPLLKRAENLGLHETKLKNNLVPELGLNGFTELKYLESTCCSGMECVLKTDGLNDSIAFQNLEYLKFNVMHDLKFICKGEAPSGTFSNLRHLELKNLRNLEYALPLALLPRKLTEICINFCESMKVIFNENDCEPSDVWELEEHKEKDVVIDLPLLNSMVIHEANNLVSLSGPSAKFSINPEVGIEGQAFFNRKNISPSLELLHMSYCNSIEHLWSKELDVSSFTNLNEIKIEYCASLQSLGSASVFSALMQLGSLFIYWCTRIKNVVTEETEELEQKTIAFRQLRELKLECLRNLESFYGGNCKIEFPKLKKLKLHSLSCVFQDPTTLFNDQVMCTSLEQLDLIDCPKIEYLWSKELDMSSFRNLNKIEINYCGGFQSLGSPFVFSALVQLESLTIQRSWRIQEVITKETEELEIPQNTIKFRQLRELHLDDLLILQIFYGGCFRVEFPKLMKLNLRILPQLTAFVVSKDPTTLFNDKIVCPSLEQLELYGCGKVEYLWSKEFDMSSFRNLNEIEIRSCDNFKSLGSPSVFSALMQLGSLLIDGCKTMKNAITKETEDFASLQKAIVFRQLRELKLRDLKTFESFYGGSYNVKFPRLKKLELSLLPSLIAFFGKEDSITLFNDKVEFPSLEELEVKGVFKDTVTQLWHSYSDHGPEEGGNDECVIFPRLKTLKLDGLSIRSFNSGPNTTLHFPSLVEMEIRNCDNLEVFCAGKLVAPELKEVDVYRCQKMLQFISGNPSQVVELLSLERVVFKYGTSMESFSVGPLNAPNLVDVWLTECKPEMQQWKSMIQTRNV